MSTSFAHSKYLKISQVERRVSVYISFQPLAKIVVIVFGLVHFHILMCLDLISSTSDLTVWGHPAILETTLQSFSVSSRFLIGVPQYLI